jgi:rhamnopyranosyl-N-acetylglucosaminyl-diphospho-decaprenol beta-1,3/1,4-galactofuranosyltransferase
MTRKLPIASVTVAYNAAHLLPQQLDVLQRQSRPLDEIVVVNNASTDGTLRLLSAEYPQVTILDLPANTGTGGGFAAGLAYAMGKKYDWVWLLDHDSVPREDGLEALLQGLELIKDLRESICILAPSPIHTRTQLSYPGVLWRRGWVHPRAEVLNQPVCFVDAVISSGSLVRREAVEKAGLPRADFFIDFVDFEFCLRLQRHGYKIAMVRDSHLDHAIGDPRTFRVFGHSKTWPVQPPWREYYFSRNYTFTIWSHYRDWRSKLFVFRKLLRHAVGILALGEHRRACLRMMFLGFLDGRAGRLGARFPDSTTQRAPTTLADQFDVVESTGEHM